MTGVPKIVVSRLAAGNSQAAKLSDHPDANLLTAFTELALADGDRLEVLRHLAQCGDCRELVWLATPPIEAATAAPTNVSAPWFSWPVLRWGAAIACVAVVGTAITLRQRETHSSPVQERSAMQLPAPESRQAQTTLAQSDSAAAAPKPSPATPSATDRQMSELQPVPGADLAMQHTTPRAKAEVTAQGGAVTPDETDDPLTRNQIDSLVPGRAKDASAEAAGSNMPANGPLEAETAPMTADRILVPAASMAPRWTLTAEGTLQRSTDLGRTWQPISIPNAAGISLRALAANGFDIWVGGTAGALYHSADAGQHWTRIQPASGDEQLTSDIIGVEFPDSDHGRLNTSSGGVWTTEDAGVSWKKQ